VTRESRTHDHEVHLVSRKTGQQRLKVSFFSETAIYDPLCESTQYDWLVPIIPQCRLRCGLHSLGRRLHSGTATLSYLLRVSRVIIKQTNRILENVWSAYLSLRVLSVCLEDGMDMFVCLYVLPRHYIVLASDSEGWSTPRWCSRVGPTAEHLMLYPRRTNCAVVVVLL
jgi:hypothetical protein